MFIILYTIYMNRNQFEKSLYKYQIKFFLKKKKKIQSHTKTKHSKNKREVSSWIQP